MIWTTTCVPAVADCCLRLLQKKIRDGFKKAADGGETPLVSLPKQNLPASTVRARLREKVSHVWCACFAWNLCCIEWPAL